MIRKGVISFYPDRQIGKADRFRIYCLWVRLPLWVLGYSSGTGLINHFINFIGRYKRNNLKDLKHESYGIFCRCICIEGNADVCKQSAPSGGRGRRITRKNFCPNHAEIFQW